MATRVSAFPEVLDVVFSFNGEEETARCMRVCRAWQGPSRRRLWTSVVGLRPLLSVLTPVEKEYETVYDHKQVRYFRKPTSNWTHQTLSRAITIIDWVRALPYFQLIHTLTLNMREKINDFSLFEVAVSHPTGRNFFSGLKAVEFDCTCHTPLRPILLRLASVFLHGGINRLSFRPPEIESAEHGDRVMFLLADATRLSPNVSHIIFRPRELDNYMFQRFSHCFHLLARWKRIQVVTLPTEILMPDILFYLADFALLEEVCTYGVINDQFLWKPSTFRFQFAGQPRVLTLTNLVRLELFATLEGIGSFLGTRHTFPSLKTLCVVSSWDENGKHVGLLLQRLAIAAPALEQIMLSRKGNPIGTNCREDAPAIQFGDLSSLSQFRDLSEFILSDTRPIALDDEELVRLVSSCPKLWNLRLNPYPYFLSTTSITLRVLESLSMHCPLLQELVLYLNAEDVKEYLEAAITPGIQNLLKVSLGVSPVSATSTDQLLLYLGRVLNPACTINPMDSAWSTPEHDKRRRVWLNVARLWANRS